MECSAGSKGMKAINKRSSATGVSQTAEEVVRRDKETKFAQSELGEVDKMNIFDEQEFCKSSNSIGEIMSELIGGKRPKNPPKKERKKKNKKFLTTSTTLTDQVSLVGSQQRLENHNAISASELNSNGTLMKDNNACSSPGYTENSTTGPTPAQKKRRKIMAKKGPRLRPDYSETTSSVTKRSKSTSKRAQQELKCKKYPSGSRVKTEKASEDIVSSQMPTQVQNCYLPSKYLMNDNAAKLDVRLPVAPMATKVFYSQRNQRIRSAITHLYYESSAKEPSASTVKPQVSLHSTATSSCYLVPNNVFKEQIDHHQEKTEKPTEILGESSEVSGPHKILHD